MNANQIAQVASFLNVSPNQVKRCEEWAHVLFVVVHGCRPQFVSKKVAKMEVPELQGSEKQVKWANEIRAQVIEKIQASIRDCNKPIIGSPKPATAKILDEGLQALLIKQVKASFWIENRFDMRSSCWEEECQFALPASRIREIRKSNSEVSIF